MLSLDRCRGYLGPHCPLNDNEVEALRDQLYRLAAVVLDAFAETSPPELVEDDSA